MRTDFLLFLTLGCCVAVVFGACSKAGNTCRSNTECCSNTCSTQTLKCANALTTKSAAPNGCGRHGDSCVSDADCCNGIRCHKYAQRCQVQITAEELLAQREKILGKRKN